MATKTQKPNRTMQAWIDAQQRHGLSHAQVQMARELGMNPAKLGKLDNHDQEPWKMPLREYLELLRKRLEDAPALLREAGSLRHSHRFSHSRASAASAP